jgi:two-component system LytT family response regulator
LLKKIEKFVEKKCIRNFTNNPHIQKMAKYIAVKTIKNIQVLKETDVLFLESSGRYTIIHLKNKKNVVACKNLGFYEKIFDNKNFIRVHNSFIVNLEYVSEIIKDLGGYYCMLEAKNIVPISKRKFSKVKEYLYM